MAKLQGQLAADLNRRGNIWQILALDAMNFARF